MNYTRANDFEKFFVAHLNPTIHAKVQFLSLDGPSAFDLVLNHSDGTKTFFDVKQHGEKYRERGWIKIAKDVHGTGHLKYVDVFKAASEEGEDNRCNYFLTVIEPGNIYVIDMRKVAEAVQSGELQLEESKTDDKELGRQIRTLAVKINDYSDPRFCRWTSVTDMSKWTGMEVHDPEYVQYWKSSAKEKEANEKSTLRRIWRANS